MDRKSLILTGAGKVFWAFRRRHIWPKQSFRVDAWHPSQSWRFKVYYKYRGLPRRHPQTRKTSETRTYELNVLCFGRPKGLCLKWLLVLQNWFRVKGKDGKTHERYLFLFKARILVCKVRKISEDRYVFVLKEIIRVSSSPLRNSTRRIVDHCLDLYDSLLVAWRRGQRSQARAQVVRSRTFYFNKSPGPSEGALARWNQALRPECTWVELPIY